MYLLLSYHAIKFFQAIDSKLLKNYSCGILLEASHICSLNISSIRFKHYAYVELESIGISPPEPETDQHVIHRVKHPPLRGVGDPLCQVGGIFHGAKLQDFDVGF